MVDFLFLVPSPHRTTQLPAPGFYPSYQIDMLYNIKAMLGARTLVFYNTYSQFCLQVQNVLLYPPYLKLWKYLLQGCQYKQSINKHYNHGQ